MLGDSDGINSHSANYVDEVLENCDVFGAPDKAPHVPIAGASAVSVFNEKVQVDLLFLADLIVLHASDMFTNTRLFFLSNPRLLRKAGMFSAEDGWAHSVLPSASRWTRLGMKE